MSTTQFISGCALGALSGAAFAKTKKGKRPSLVSEMTVAMGREASVIESLNMQSQIMHDVFAAFPAMDIIDLFDVVFMSDLLGEVVGFLDAAIAEANLLAKLSAQKSDLYRITRDQRWAFEVTKDAAGNPKLRGVLTHRPHGALDRNAPFTTYAVGPVAITGEMFDTFMSPMSAHFWRA